MTRSRLENNKKMSDWEIISLPPSPSPASLHLSFNWMITWCWITLKQFFHPFTLCLILFLLFFSLFFSLFHFPLTWHDRLENSCFNQMLITYTDTRFFVTHFKCVTFSPCSFASLVCPSTNHTTHLWRYNNESGDTSFYALKGPSSTLSLVQLARGQEIDLLFQATQVQVHSKVVVE